MQCCEIFWTIPFLSHSLRTKLGSKWCIQGISCAPDQLSLDLQVCRLGRNLLNGIQSIFLIVLYLFPFFAFLECANYKLYNVGGFQRSLETCWSLRQDKIICFYLYAFRNSRLDIKNMSQWTTIVNIFSHKHIQIFSLKKVPIFI